MTNISTDNEVATLINVFTVEPENQQRLVDLLVEATGKVMTGMPGFVSANIHRSVDSTKALNYAQWESREAFEAMLKYPETIPHMREVGRVAESFEPHLYEVAFADGASPI